MKKLLIIANPSKTSFSYAMAEAYKEKAEKQKDEYKILDLYELNQTYLTYDSVENLKKWEVKDKKTIEKIQKDISWADEMSFFFPVWWGTMPAVLKTFFDSNFSSWFAFKYVSWKSMPEKLLTGKTAKIFCTCDAPWFVYKIPFILWISLKKYFASAILWFCWVKLTEFNLYDKFSSKTLEEKKQILENTKK